MFVNNLWSLTLDGSALKGKINKTTEITQLQSPTFWQVWLFCRTEKNPSTSSVLVTNILIKTNNAGFQQRYTKVERFMNSRRHVNFTSYANFLLNVCVIVKRIN